MSSKSAASPMQVRSPLNILMGATSIALSLLAWQATGRAGFVLVAIGLLALLPAWILRPASPRPGERSPRWARALVGPGVFLIVAGLFQILAR